MQTATTLQCIHTTRALSLFDSQADPLSTAPAQQTLEWRRSQFAVIPLGPSLAGMALHKLDEVRLGAVARVVQHGLVLAGHKQDGGEALHLQQRGALGSEHHQTANQVFCRPGQGHAVLTSNLLLGMSLAVASILAMTTLSLSLNASPTCSKSWLIPRGGHTAC